MNKDEFDKIFPHLKPTKTNSGLDLIIGVEDRKYGHFKKNTKAKENVELYAEEQLVRKEFLDEMRCEMPGLPRSTFLMVFSPDGQRVASTHGNHNIYVTDIKSGKNLRTLVGHPRTPWCIAFHPTSNQIVASGCLGGQVRIWDLSGGSEVWTTSNQSVIASIAFHPNDRILVIATVNEVYFWDWSRPEPFVHASTSNPKEKVRFVAFDKLGHKLITGIANSPQTRWERVRAPVPVPRQERCASPYRRRITQRLVNNTGTPPPAHSSTPETPLHNREPLSGVPERERRITVCYRNLVREYEQLVHRYLQLYRPPTMIDRGTDPMEQSSLSNSGTQTPEPSTSGITSEPSTSGTSAAREEKVDNPRIDDMNATNTQTPLSNNLATGSGTSNSSFTEAQPSTSSGSSQNLITPSRIFCVIKKPNTLIRGTQTSESRKHKADAETPETSQEKRFKKCDSSSSTVIDTNSPSPGSSQVPLENSAEVCNSDHLQERQMESGPSTQSGDRVLVVNLQRLNSDDIPPQSFQQGETDTTDATNDLQQPSTSGGRSGSRRDLEDDLWVPGASHTERILGLNEYIRVNQERLAAIQRRRRLRTGGTLLENTVPASPSEQFSGQEESSPTTGLNLSSNSTAEDFRIINQSPELNDAQFSESSNSNSGRQRNVDELLSNIRRTAEEEVRNRILPIIRSVPANDRPELIRLFENSRELVRMRFRQMCPTLLRKPNRRPVVIDTSTDSSSSETEEGTPTTRLTQRSNSEPDSQTQTNSTNNVSVTGNSGESSSNITNTSAGMSGASNSVTGNMRVRNFNTELEQLVTSLLTEIERNETERSESNNSTPSVQTTSFSSLNTSGDSPSSARTRPSTSRLRSTGLGESGEHLFFPSPFARVPNDQEDSALFNSPPSAGNTTSNLPNSPSAESLASYMEASARTIDPLLISSGGVTRRRFFSHRMSAFMPTRVNYTRTSSSRLRRSQHTLGRGRSGPRLGAGSFALDELINFSEREAEDPDPPSPQWNFHPFDPPPEFPSINPENIGIGNMYSNIVQDLESSLNDVRNIRASNRPGETSDMLSSFSERLENIMNQSDTILRNLRSSMEMLPTASDGSTRSREGEPSWNFNDQGFYVRDLRNENGASSSTNTAETSSTDTLNLQDLFAPFSAVAADHTYPRNPNDSTRNDNMSPLMTSLHLTISHIQRQARLLRRQVESIERIDRAMLEVAQLQLIRQLIIELIRHVRAASGENRSTGMSSVRQMMAGTRISDSSPYDSPGEEAAGDSNDPIPQQPINLSANRSEHRGRLPGPVTGNSSNNTDQPTSSTGATRRTSGRKTYPPSRLSRHCPRRSSIVHWFSRRYTNRGDRSNSRQPLNTQSLFNYSIISPSTLSLMTRRLEHLLTDQMRIFTRPQDSPQVTRTSSSIDLGEHIVALRLHGCLLRMTRVLGSTIESSSIRNLHTDATAAVTHDGTTRYGARHTLSLIVDGMSRHIEELGNSHIPQSMRVQIHGVLAMSLLLTELLLLQVVDSIPPPTGMNLDPERENLTNRIDQMCTQMLHSRFSGNSQQLTRSLRLMRLTMRHAHRALGQTYNARRNAMMPRQDTDRRQLLGSINRCLRTIHRRRPSANVANAPSPSENELNTPRASADAPDPRATGDGNISEELYLSTINNLIASYGEFRDDNINQPSTSTGRTERHDQNSDADDVEEESRWNSRQTPRQEYVRQHFGILDRSNSEQTSHPRPWNIPTVQINDGPMANEPTPLFTQRLMSQRQRFAERVSELRSNPAAGLFRPRFLHPLYASINPFDADLDDPQREQIYDSDMITTVTPNHRIQAWDISNWSVPVISNSLKNIVVSECKIHNDASVDVAKDGTILVTLLPSGGYLNVTNRLGIYSLRWETLGQCLYTTSFEQNAVSVSLSPLSRHLAVGLASRRVSIVPSDRWVMARIFKIEQKDVPGDRLPILRELEQSRESRINCIRWLPVSGQGFIYATNTGQLIILS